MTRDELNEVMTALGPADEEVMAVLRNSDTDWLVRYADADVEVSLADDGNRVVFCALCGVAPAGRAAAVNAALLRFNAIWRDTGSVRMAATGEDGEALLIADVFGPQASPQHVALVARNVADRASAWRLIVEAGAPDAPAAADYAADTAIFRI